MDSGLLRSYIPAIENWTLGASDLILLATFTKHSMPLDLTKRDASKNLGIDISLFIFLNSDSIIPSP